MKEKKKNQEMRFYLKSPDGKSTYYNDDNFLYVQKENEKYRLDIFDKHYYKLKIYNGVPVLEIDGLRMQLIKEFKTPLKYSEELVKELKLNNEAHILDTCFGLGYTAIAASKFTDKITCFELAEAVIKLAKWNPFSNEAFENQKFNLKIGDGFELIKEIKNEEMSAIIHDPPRFSHASQLYSDEFYSEMYRVSKYDAKLFHYVGGVGKNKGRRIELETLEKLKNAGFRNIKILQKFQGLIFTK